MRASPSHRSWSRPRRPRPRRRHRRPQRSSVMGRRILGRLGAALTCATGVLLAVATAASLAAQRAFDVYRGEKMSHTPVTLMRAAPGKPWLRIEGFVTPDELVDDYRNLLTAP